MICGWYNIRHVQREVCQSEKLRFEIISPPFAGGRSRNWRTLMMLRIGAESFATSKKCPARVESRKSESKRTSSMIPVVKAKLLEGKKGLIVGIANENSIAWGCAKAFRAFGADLAVTYLNDKAKKYVAPLARDLEAAIMLPL